MSNPIIEGADGITLTSTGLIVLRELADFVDVVLADNATDKKRAFRLMLAINHEGTHFLQCFTAAFPYSFALSIWELSAQIMAASRNGKMSSDVVRDFRNAFASRTEQFIGYFRGISTIDLLEAMAVTEGYRTTVTENQNNARDFLLWLHQFFPDPSSTYRKAIDVVTEKFV